MDVSPQGESKSSSDRKRLLVFGEYSDVIIKIDGEAFNLHKNILCLSSPFFEKALGVGMKEAKTGTIELGSDNLSIDLRRLIAWIYLQEYDIDIPPLGDLKITKTHFHRARVHYKMYLLGDEFMVPELKVRALANFHKSVADHLAKLKTPNTRKRRNQIGEFFLEIADKLHVDKDVRHKDFLPVLTAICIDNFATMSQSEHFVKALTTDHAVLAASVLAGQVAREQGWSWT